MNKIGKYKFNIDSYLTDFQGKITLSSVVNLLLQAATRHAQERGFGYNYVHNMGRAWVLSRLAVEMYEYPKIDSIFFINTWISGVNNFFTERNFSFENEKGEIIGYAKSIWASINIETRRPENVKEVFGIENFIIYKENPIEKPHKIAQLKNEQAFSKFTVRYSDVDINNHLNSVKYIEHFVDIFDIQHFKFYEIRRMEIHFAAEAVFGQRLYLLKKEEDSNDFFLEMRDDEKLISAARIVWK
ncbi:MAG: thioesterase [Paludibacter sp.]|nr:thioesterase [Paludibacter sp.]